MIRKEIARSVTCRLTVALLVITVLCSPAANAGRGWAVGRLPDLAFLDRVDAVCAGTFAGESRPVGGAVAWRTPSGWIARPGPRIATFHVDHVIKGDKELAGRPIQVLYVATLALPPTVRSVSDGGTVFPDLAQKLRGKRCLLQLLSHGDGTWEIRFGGDSYMVLGQKPDVADWADLTEWQRLEQEFASAILDPDPLVAAYAIASVASTPTPAAGRVLTSALLRRQAEGPSWLARMATTGLVGIGHLDTIYKLRHTLDEWRAHPATGYPQEIAFGMPDCISRIRTRNAVPALVELSSYHDAGIRWAATLALRRLGGKGVVAALAARLDDESSGVRYQAIQGLAHTLEPRDVGVENWSGYAPATHIYKQDPDTPVRNWKRWWQEKGKAKYPPVEQLLKKAERFRRERPWAREAKPQE